MPERDGHPAVSVVMPVYNGADRLRTAVESVLTQTEQNLELIIVDDASEDDTVRIAQRYVDGDARVRLLRQAQNRGQAAARNLALETARGRWIAPVDADDEIHPDRLRLLAEAGDRSRADLIADGVIFRGERRPGVPAELMSWPRNNRELELLSAETFIRSDIPAGGRCSLGYLKPLMRLRFLNERGLRYDEDLRFTEDFHLYARALFCGARFLLFPGSHYVYRQTRESASRTDRLMPSMAKHAVTSSRSLRAAVPRGDRNGVAAALAEHEKRWSLVQWFEQMKYAVADGRFRKAIELLASRPAGPRDMLRFANDRARLKQQQP